MVSFTRSKFSFYFPLFSYVFVVDLLQRVVVRRFLCERFRYQRCFDQIEKSHQIPICQYVLSDLKSYVFYVY